MHRELEDLNGVGIHPMDARLHPTIHGESKMDLDDYLDGILVVQGPSRRSFRSCVPPFHVQSRQCWTTLLKVPSHEESNKAYDMHTS